MSCSCGLRGEERRHGPGARAAPRPASVCKAAHCGAHLTPPRSAVPLLSCSLVIETIPRHAQFAKDSQQYKRLQNVRVAQHLHFGGGLGQASGGSSLRVAAS
jgi:hypothetical protein